MEVFTNAAQEVWARLSSFALSLQFWDILDILVIAYLIYRLLLVVRKTNTSRLLTGVLMILLAMWLSDGRLNALHYLLGNIVSLGLVALVVLFQPEIRRVLEQVGSSKIPLLNLFSKPQVDRQVVEGAIHQTVEACADMRDRKSVV